MSLENKAEKLLDAVAALISAVTEMVKGARPEKATTTAAAAPGSGLSAPEKKATKKDIAEAKKTAKTKAGEILKAFGKAKLAELLELSKAKRFSDLKDMAAFEGFIDNADSTLAKGDPAVADDDDDLLSTSTTPAKEYTLEDVQTALLKVNNTEGLGKDITRQILGDLGAPRLNELKKAKFGDAVNMAEKAIAEAI